MTAGAAAQNRLGNVQLGIIIFERARKVKKINENRPQAQQNVPALPFAWSRRSLNQCEGENTAVIIKEIGFGFKTSQGVLNTDKSDK